MIIAICNFSMISLKQVWVGFGMLISQVIWRNDPYFLINLGVFYMFYFYIKIEPANRRSFQRIDWEKGTVTIALRLVR